MDSQAAAERDGFAPFRLMASALEHHKAGDLGQAEALYTRVLDIEPEFPHALHHLGIIRHLRGDHERAIELIGRAIKHLPGHAGAYSNLGAAQLAAGNIVGAEASFRRAVELNPDLAEAHSNLAAVLNDLGRWEEAVAAYRAAQRAAPEAPKFLKRLGDLYLEHQQYDEAIDCFERFLSVAADDGEVNNNLGYCHEKRGDWEKALLFYRRAAELCPDSPEINHNAGSACARLGYIEEAEAFFNRAIRIEPEKWKDLSRLAATYVNRRQIDRAFPIYERLIAEQPENAEIYNDYGTALSAAGRVLEAEALFEKAIALKPDFAAAYNNLGSNRVALGRRSESIECFKKAIQLSPRYLDAHINICLALVFERRIDEAYMFARATVLLENFRSEHFSNPHKVFRAVCDFDAIEELGDLWDATDRIKNGDIATNFLEMLTLAATEEQIDRLSELHRRWYRTTVKRLVSDPLPPPQPRKNGGRLRIGIISSDLRAHSVAKFVLPVLEHYDRERFEIRCYSPFEQPGDMVQQRIKSLVSDFKVIRNCTDREFAEEIRKDGIDILFELNGFTRDTRLRVLAYKPAPVQIYWLGYPFTTGIEEIDYILLDPYVKPVKESWFAEKPLLMPECWVCFGSFAPEPISEKLPVERNGVVTFGSLNNPYKINRETIALWSRVMHEVPGSRFLYVRPECSSFTLCSNLTREFQRNGISPDRLYLVNNRATGLSHFSCYDEIDITLDTFPLTGGTTTCDTLWMGAPVVTKYGPSMHQRLSYSMLMNLCLDQLCVQTDDEFVRVASELARDTEALRFLRRELRRSVQESALGRAADYARHFCDLMEQVAVRHGLR